MALGNKRVVISFSAGQNEKYINILNFINLNRSIIEDFETRCPFQQCESI